MRIAVVVIVAFALVASPGVEAASDETDANVSLGMYVLKAVVGTLLSLLFLALVFKGGLAGVARLPELYWRMRKHAKATGRNVVVISHVGATGFFGTPPMMKMAETVRIERFLRKHPGPADLIITTYGGELFAGLRLARFLHRHPNVRVVVPKYAFSAGTLTSIAAKVILADPDAMFGPVDPQFGGGFLEGPQSAKDWREVADRKGAEARDATMANGVVGRRIMDEMRTYLAEMLPATVDRKGAIALLLDGDVSHARAIRATELKGLGFNVATEELDSVHRIVEAAPDGVHFFRARRRAA